MFCKPGLFISSVGLTATLIFTAGVAGDLSPGVNLFFIKRSLNRNEVHYDASVDTERCVWKEPYVNSYWRDLAEGKKEYSDIKWWEHRAYGFHIDVVSETEIHIKLRPFYSNGIYRPVIARLTDKPSGCNASATMRICGTDADFQSAFIQASDSGWPDYVYIELLGYTPGTRGSGKATNHLSERFDKSRVNKLIKFKDPSRDDDDFQPYCSLSVKSRWVSGVIEDGAIWDGLSNRLSLRIGPMSINFGA